MKRTLQALAIAVLLSSAADAQITNPIRYTWIVTSCENWNCAAAALVLANGDKHVIVLPTGQETRPWLVLRRVEAGSVFIPEDEPFGCEVFNTLVDATSRYTSMDACHGALVLNVPDGRAVVASLHKCAEPTTRRRALR